MRHMLIRSGALAVIALGAVGTRSAAGREAGFACVIDQSQSIHAYSSCPNTYRDEEQEVDLDLAYACAYYCTPGDSWLVQCYYGEDVGSGPSNCPATPRSNM
jgi:hypothetical protein